MAVPATAEQMTATAGKRMRAIVQTEYGTADVLRLAEIERPVIGADEVLVKVRAAGLDRGTWHLMGARRRPHRRPTRPRFHRDGAGCVRLLADRILTAEQVVGRRLSLEETVDHGFTAIEDPDAAGVKVQVSPHLRV